MLYFLIIIGFVLSFLLSVIIIPRILVVAYRKRLFDIPNERKVHHGIIPRLGCISFVPAILFSISFTTGLRYLIGYEISGDMLCIIIPEFYFFICGLTLLYLAGIKDDLVGLRYRSKFVVQIIAASLIPLSGLWINNLYGILGIHELAPWLGIPLTILVVVFICNAINMIDGIDGLASGLSIISLGLLGSLYLSDCQWIYASLAFSVLGTLLPFFYYNVFGKANHCTKIFMGDTGSLTLGYILAFLAICYTRVNPEIHPPYSSGVIIIAFSSLIVPAFDLIRVVLIRARNHKPLFLADRNHIHHKCLSAGLTGRKAVICMLGLACAFILLNMVLINTINNNFILVLDILLWFASIEWLNKSKEHVNDK